MSTGKSRAPWSWTMLVIVQILILSASLLPTAAFAQDAVEPAQPEAAAESAPSAVALYIHPDPLQLTVGDSQRVSAWTCDPAIVLPLGADQEPASVGCQPVQAEWSLNDAAAAVASLSIDEDETGKRTRVTTPRCPNAPVSNGPHTKVPTYS